MIHHGFEFLDINHGSFLELRLKSNFSDYEFLSLSFFFFFFVKNVKYYYRFSIFDRRYSVKQVAETTNNNTIITTQQQRNRPKAIQTQAIKRIIARRAQTYQPQELDEKTRKLPRATERRASSNPECYGSYSFQREPIAYSSGESEHETIERPENRNHRRYEEKPRHDDAVVQ